MTTTPIASTISLNRETSGRRTTSVTESSLLASSASLAAGEPAGGVAVPAPAAGFTPFGSVPGTGTLGVAFSRAARSAVGGARAAGSAEAFVGAGFFVFGWG